MMDGLGNVVGSALDGSNGPSDAAIVYDSWGNVVTDSTAFMRLGRLRFGFKGMLYDETTGLYNARARWYQPDVGRFMSEDPAGLAGGINQYAFAADDPINNSDPSGALATDQDGSVCSINAESCGEPLETGAGGGIGGAVGGDEGGFSNNIGAGDAGPGRHLTDEEIKQLGNLCNAVDCSKVVVIDTPFDRSLTLGHTIFLSSSDEGNLSVLAHEMAHVARYEQYGTLRYIKDGVIAQWHYSTGKSDPYVYSGLLDGRSFFNYGIEQQGQMVEDRVKNPRKLVCSMVPYP
jgi:RHS repeat-associated protein